MYYDEFGSARTMTLIYVVSRKEPMRAQSSQTRGPLRLRAGDAQFSQPWPPSHEFLNSSWGSGKKETKFS
eukprot:scaffold196757_cov26-Prasinocladus_malaysianus.AAC.1